MGGAEKARSHGLRERPLRNRRAPSWSGHRRLTSVRVGGGALDGSRAGLRPPLSRVGDWRAGLGRSLCCLLARSFVCECHTISAVPRFQPPPRRTQHADFPHCALLFASPQGLWDLSCRSGFRRWSNHSVAIEQLQSLVQPSPTPPRPAEALSVPGNPRNFQDVSAFALTYILRLRSCKSMDAFVISSLPSLWSETLQTAGLLRSAGVTPPHRCRVGGGALDGSRAGLRPPLSRVGDWRAGLGRSLCSLLARSFVCECHTISAVPRFQLPPRRTQHADFPHCALLFASPQG